MTKLRNKAIGVLGVLLLIMAITAYATYNRLVNSAEAVHGSWAQVQNVMKRRADLVPALVNVTREYARHEAALIDSASQRHAAYINASGLNNQVSAMRELEDATARLKENAERTPAIESSRIYRNLHYELAGSENRIAVERRRYNKAVADYAALRRTVRGRVVAGLLSFESVPPQYPQE